MRENGLSYLLFLRLVPAFPFFLVNLACGVTGLPLRTYALGTLFGIVPGSLVFALDLLKGAGSVWLGDVVIAMGTARRQARAAGHGLADELRLLALHGLLHLLGYDHERDGGAMARLESRLRRQAGLPQGLIERAAGLRC